MRSRCSRLALAICAAIACAADGSAAARVGDVRLDRTSWFWSATPAGDSNLLIPPNSVAEHGRLEWYNARFVKERDLNPELQDAEGGDNERQVLELRVKSPTGQLQILPTNWTGLTHTLSSAGQDYTRFHFMDLWLNDFAPYPAHVSIQGKLHIDLGQVSEDAFWDPDSVPNGRLDTEDKNRDGKLDRNGDPSIDEDTGLDGLHSVNEPGVGPDPHHDDYYFNPDLVPLDYSGINNMERNGTGDVDALPDTEDLNLDGFLDLQETFFRVTIDLADTSRFVTTDVTRDYGQRTDLEHPISPNNGWRKYRIPLSEEAFLKVGAASWGNVGHLRLWVDGMNGPVHQLQVGGIEFLDSLGRTMPRTPVVHQNAPNPFNPGTTIRFELPDPGRVRLRVYDAHGRLVRTLLDEERPSGYFQVFWNGEDASGRRVGSGVYWYRVELPSGSPQTRKMVMAR